jgi:outer membrane protein assembly factor BamB
VPRGVVAGAALALVLALVLAAWNLLDDGPGAGRTSRAVRAARVHTQAPVYRVRWGVDFDEDPTALLVDGPDAFVTEPYAVSSIGVAGGVTRWRVDVKDAEPWIAASADTVLVAATDGFEALDRASGASRWRVTIDDPYDRGRTVGLVATPSGPVAVLTTQRGGVAGVDAQSGATRWSATVDGTPRGQVVGDDRTGLVALEMEHADRVELHVLDGATGVERWSAALGPVTGLPLVDGSRLVLDAGEVGSGTVIAFDLATGARVWSTAVPSGAEADEGGIVDGDRLVMVDDLGTVTTLDRRTGRRLWQRDLPAIVLHGRPIAIGRVLVFRGFGGAILTIRRDTGRFQGRFRINGNRVGFGGSPAGLVFARSLVAHHQVVGLPAVILTMHTDGGPPREVLGREPHGPDVRPRAG